MNRWNLRVDTDSQKLKADFFCVGIVKNVCDQSRQRTLMLAASSILDFCMLVQIQEY